MKVCVVALDALEYNLVVDFNLRTLKQEEYGKIDVSSFEALSTPIIWGSFITGLDLTKLGLQLHHEVITTPHKLLRLTPERMRHVIPLGIRRQFFKTVPIRQRDIHKDVQKPYREIRQRFKELNLTTLFDIPNSVSVSVPPYQKWVSDKALHLNKKLVERKIPFVIYQEHLYNVFRRKKEQLLDVIGRGGWSLVMAHFLFTDSLAHFRIQDRKKMFEVYLEAENLIKEVKNVLPEKTMLLVVSDHGMEYRKDLKFGDHTPYGFYSCNKKLGLSNPKITDFYRLILEQVRTG